MPRQATPLTDTKIRSLKPKEKPYKEADGDGMYLLVKPNGSKHWHMDYTLHGKRNTASFGPYPEVTLLDARNKRLEARRLIADGIAPAQHKLAVKQAVLAVKANTFESVATEWFEQRLSTKSASHQSRTRAYLANDLIPYLGEQPIASIEAPDLLKCLQRIEARKNAQGTPVTETANRVCAILADIWRYAVSTGRAKYNIAADLKGALKPHKATNHAHITEPAVLGQLIQDIRGYRGSPITKAAMLLSPMLFPRPGELRKARWSEIDFDAKQWRYFVTKTEVDHIVPLPDQAIAILKDLQVLTGNDGYVFRGRSSISPMSDSTINIALQGLGYTSDMITPHGFRHTAATMLADRLGFPEHEIEIQLSHKVGGVKGVYQKSKYLDNRTLMMQAWADYLDQISA